MSTATAGTVAHLAWRRGGANPRIVLLHGFTDAGCCWDPWLDAFDAPALTIDARGHGDSTLPEGPISPEIQAADVALVIDELSRAGELDVEGGLVVIGHSMGASTTATLARDRPDLVRGAVLGDPPATVRPAVSSRSVEGWLHGAREGTVEDAIGVCHAANPSWPDSELEPWVRSKRQLDLGVFDRPRPATSALPDVLRDVVCPVLLLHGDPGRGGLVTPEMAAECVAARAATGNIESHRLANSGHNLRREDAEGYRAVVVPWVNQRLGT